MSLVKNERGRITSGAARAVLAKVHLTLEEWQDVIDVSDPLGGTYSLRPSYIDNFYGQIGDTSGENRVESFSRSSSPSKATGRPRRSE